MPSFDSSGTSTSRKRRACRSISARVPAQIRSSTSRGISPEAARTATSAAIRRFRPATRTMKNSSRLLAKIAAKRTRSSSGSLASSASSSTRWLKWSQESSRSRNRSSYAATAARAASSGWYGGSTSKGSSAGTSPSRAGSTEASCTMRGSVAPTGEPRVSDREPDRRGVRRGVARLSIVPAASSFLAAADLRLKTWTLKAALGLPERLQRRLAGKRVVLDGQTLAVDTQLMLRLEKLVREPEVASLPVPEGRRVLLLQTVIAGGDQPIGAVRDVPMGELRGRLFVPDAAMARGPLLVYFHGGGWVYGDLDSHDPTCRFLAERSGVRVLSVEYGLAPEHPFPAAYDDAVTAYRWVISHAADLGGDPARLAIGGDSAGGNLAAAVALLAAREGLPLAFQLLVYPGTDASTRTESKRLFGHDLYLTEEFMDQVLAWYAPEQADRADPRVSPLLDEIPPGLAPAYVATAGFDPLRDEGEAYARKLADAGVSVELRRFADQIHGFLSVVGVGRTARAASAEVAAALARGVGVGQ